jgi:hypothetical protein
MNNSISEIKALKALQPNYNRDDIIILLQKVQYDFNMLDSKMKAILDSENIDMESLGDVVKSFKEAYTELNEYAEIRNKKIKELLNAVNINTITDN